MGFFDQCILAVLKDGKPRSFSALLGEVGFSHNTLHRHLQRLAAQGIVVKEKTPSRGLGRPKFVYHVPSKAQKQVVAALQNPYEELVALPFSRLRHICRFEKGDTAENEKKMRSPKLPPNPKRKIKTIFN